MMFAPASPHSTATRPEREANALDVGASDSSKRPSPLDRPLQMVRPDHG
jgi:hypothetical protein